MAEVVDASVAVKWFVEEEALSAEAEALLLGGGPLIAPDLLLVEVANALWAMVRRGRIGSQQAQLALQELETIDLEFVQPGPLLSRAFALAGLLGHPVYDCLYLACAEACDASLVTADQRFLRAVAGTAFTDRVRLLGGV